MPERVDEHRGLDRRGDLPSVHALDALGVPVPRRRGVEHDASADGRLRPENHPVTTGGDDRSRESRLCMDVSAEDPRESVRSSEVHLHPRPVLDRLQLLERDVQPVRDRVGAGDDQRVPANDFAPLDPGEAHGDPLAGSGAVDVAVVHLHAANSYRRDPGSTCSSSPVPIEPDQSVPVTTVPIPRRENERSTKSRVGRSARSRETPSAARPSAAGSSRPAPVPRAHGNDLRVGDELVRLLQDKLERLRVDGVRLRHRHDAALDPEQPQDGEVLVRLRTGASPASTTSRKRSIPVAPATIVRTNRS